jgi:type IV pilus assembly protein PilB
LISLVFIQEIAMDAAPASPKTAFNAEDAPVVTFVQQLLEQAVALKASDLHFEPYEHHYRVRMRIDGELREMACPHMALKDRLASRIKVMSRLDIAEKRVPQDGRMKLNLADGRELDLRVSTLPTLFGEKLVVRVLDSAQAQLDLQRLGYEPEDLERLLTAIRAPHGLVLVTGPTGSGKTQSLYAGINQVNVQDKPGLTFAVALRAFLRQDPDILMVGEVRDLETANIAIQAAQTGHLVLSTLHTNDAPATLVRLRNMGTAPYNIAASVSLVTAQRLVRCLCRHCKQASQLPTAILRQAGWPDSWCTTATVQVFEAVGCAHCHKGFSGRTGIFEVMPVSPVMQDLVLQEASIQDMTQQARREGVNSLRIAGLRKVLQGITSLDEVLLATRDGT